MDLLELLWLYSGYTATKDRDHLFALLELANIPHNPLSSPDHTARLLVIVNRYARYFVRFGRGSIRLLYSAAGISTNGRFPSWIPNWTLDNEETGKGYDITRRFVESPKGFYLIARSHQPCELARMAMSTIMDHIFSSVTVVGENHFGRLGRDERNTRQCVEQLGECDNIACRISTYPTGEKI